MEEKKRIMSGMRPTGRLHLGHYLGVLKNWKQLQEDYDCFFSVADWHALTTGYDKTDVLKENVLNVVMDWLACGIDPDKATVFVQSTIPEVAELNIYLGMVTPQNWVERDPTLKDMAKILKNKEGQNSQIGFGLMGYPVLMSADIVSVNAHYVPVGKDQVAHVELTRDMVRRFNNVYKTNYFVEPQPKLNECSLICGVDGAKMGKSFNNDIKISDTEEVTAKRIMQCITDRSRARKNDPGHPDKCEVAFKYWQIFGNENEIADIEKECIAGARGCADCKRQLAAKVNEYFKDIREKRKYYEAHLDEVQGILEEGSAKARKVTQKVLNDVRNIIGMY
ncbi:tryptophan--tRNA ligase [bacterium]|nr:tryptophan--tRNA ligase [bacterium]